MNEGAPGLPVGDLQRGGATVLHLDLMGRIIQLIALGGFQLHHLIPALFRFGQGNNAGAVGGVGAHDLAVELADFKLYAADPLPGFLVRLDDGQAAHLRVIHGDGLRVAGIDLDRLRPGALIHDVTGQGLGFRDDQGAHNAGNADFAVGVGLVKALAGQVAVVVVQVGAVRIGDLELHPGQGFAGLLVQLLHHDAALLGVVKTEGLDFAGLDKDGLGLAVQHIALQCLDLPCGDGGARGQVVQDDAPILVGDELAVGVAHHRAGAVGNKERNAFQRCSGALNILLDHKSGAGGVGEVEGLRVVGVHYHRLRPGGLVDGVAGDGGRFRHHQRPHHAVDGDFAVLVGEIQAVAADLSVFSRYELARGGGHLEGDALQGLPGEGIPFVDDQRTGLGVFHDDGLRVAALPDDNIGAGGVHDIPGGGLDFSQDVSAGGKVGDLDFSLGVGGEDSILGQRGRADHAVQPYLTACRRGHAELRAGEGLAGGAVPLLDNDGPARLVLKGQADGAALFDLDGLALRVQNKASGGAGFRHYHALAGGQAGDADFAVFIGSENAVAVAHNGAVRIQNLKLGVLQGDGGVHRTDLADKQNSVRGVGKSDSDNALLPTVSQHDGFGGLDNVVPVRSVYFLQHIRAGVEARPHGGAVLPGNFGADDGAARAAGAAQIPQLERAAGEGRAGHAVIFLNDHSIFRHIFKRDNLALAALDIKFLGGGFLDGVPSGGGQLRHLIPAVPQQVNKELAVLVGEEGAQAVQLPGGRVVGAVPNLELGPLDGTAGDAVYLVYGQGGLLVVLKINGVVAVGVQRHKLAGGVHEPGRGNGLLAYLIHSGQEVGQGGPAVGVCLDLVYTVAVRRPNGENGVRNRLAGVGVLFVDDQVGPLLIFNGDGAGLAGEQLHMVFLEVKNVVGNGGRFLDGVHARFQVGDVDLAVLAGDAVKVVGAVLNPGDAEMDAAQPGAVRAGLNQPQGGFRRVREHKIGVLVRVHLHHPHGVVHQITLRRFQLPHLVCAGGQLGQVNLAVNIGHKFLPVAPAHQLELKADVGQGFHGDAVHFDKMDARFQGIEKDQLPRLRLAGL